MTEKMWNKDTIALLFVSMLTVLALVYGFTQIPSPAKQRELKLDHSRVSDLGELKYSIDDQYLKTSVLPATLNDIQQNAYSYSKTLSKVDPETGAAYEYRVLSATSYELCAVFTTDSAKDEYVYDEQNYNYSTYKRSFEHPKGRTCFNFTVMAPRNYLNNRLSPTPTYMWPTPGNPSPTSSTTVKTTPTPIQWQ